MASPTLKPVIRRKVIRRTSRVPGTIYDGSTYIPCRLENISEAGASLEFPSDAALPTVFTLKVPAENLERSCNLVWRDDDMIGVQFV
jgi:hypothetical protein